ncbi:MAG: type I restriction-modification system subunit M [Cyclobacteriaceae bacterium]
MNKQKLAAKIWESANQMRSKIEANEYKDYILGFIFYKYLSEKQIQFALEQDFTPENIKALSEEDQETAMHIRDNLGYFLSYDHLFSTWIGMGRDFDISHVTDALSAFARWISPKHKKLFEGIFSTLETGLSKLGETAAARTKAVRELLYLIKDIPMDGRQDYDVLGYIYEYLIGMFAANAGKKAGEFYTPHEVSVLMSEIMAYHLKDHEEIQIYDPTSGSGSLLINIGNSVAKHMDDANKIKYYAQELKQNTYNLTRMNLVMRGIKPDNIITRNGDTLEDDWPYFDENDPTNSYNPLYVDAVVSNPPYSQKWDPTHKEADARYARFGLAPKAKADFAFLLHDLFHLKPSGIMTIVLPHGVLFRGGEEGKIRENLIENNHIETIIGLPGSIFFGTGIPTIIMVLRQKREKSDVLIVDASKHFIKAGKNNLLRASDIKRITDTVISRKPNPKYSAVVKKKTIRENNYNLNIPRYVDSSEPAETWDIYASMYGGIPENEVNQLIKFWETFPGLRQSLFTENIPGNLRLTAEDVSSAIQQHQSVQDFGAQFTTAFADFHGYLQAQLLEDIPAIKTNRQENILSEDIFRRLAFTTLIDKYAAYQILDDQWQMIRIDLEIIQTEGFQATRQVNPNMVTKKKNGKDQEVQDGWVGHIMPFPLVQEIHHSEELEGIAMLENRLTEITTEFEEILDSLHEEEKEADTVNEAKDAFVPKEVAKEAKLIKTELKNGTIYGLEAYETKILKVNDLITEEKALKKQIKEDADRLHMLTKKTIEGLTDAQVYELLERKWITPLVTAILQLPDTLLQTFTNQVQALADKYATTYADVAHEISEAESELSNLIGELEGSETDLKGLQELQNLLLGN